MKSQLVKGLLPICLALFPGLSGHAAPEWIAANPASEPNAFPATGPSAAFKELAAVGAVRAGDSAEPAAVDELDGEVFVAAEVPAMGVVSLSPAPAKTLSEPPLTESGGSIGVKWGMGWTFDATGISHGAERLFAAGGGWKVLHKGKGLIRLASGALTATVFATGGLMLESGGAITPEGAPKIRRASEFLIIRDPREKDAISATGEALVWKSAIAVNGGGGWKWKDGRLAPAGKVSRLLLVPVAAGSGDAAFRAAARASFPMLGKSDGAGWALFDRKREMRFAGGGRPNFSDGTWVWSDGTDSFAWVFTPAARAAHGRNTWQIFSLGKTAEAPARALQTEGGPVNLPGNGTAQPAAPAFSLYDMAGKGKFLHGDLRRGGNLVAASTGSQGALDLDGDGDGDIFGSVVATKAGSGGVDALASGGFRFDMADVMPGYYLLDLSVPAKPVLAVKGGYTEQIGPHAPMFSKSLLPSAPFEGAARGFEEHILYRIRPGDGGAIPGPASLFLKTTDDKIDRLSMGGFGRGPESYMDWNIELDPIEAAPNQPAQFRICEYTDPAGNKIRFTSSTLPERWDGGELPVRDHPGVGPDFSPHAAWFKTAKEKLFNLRGLQMTIRPEGTYESSSEGMYGGDLSMGNRIELDTDGASFVLYSSDLFGGLHLKGADYGHQTFGPGHKTRAPFALESVHRRDALDMPDRWKGARDPEEFELLRIEGPMFLGYFDADHDDYIDTYVYDADNDGLVERTLVHSPAGRAVLLRQGETSTAWAFEDKRVEVDYIPGNFGKIRDLYLEGAAVDPLVVRTELSTSGVPIERTLNLAALKTEESNDVGSAMHTATKHIQSRAFPAMLEQRPPFFLVAGPEWQSRIAVATSQSGGASGGWRDFSVSGFSSLGLQAQAAGLVQAQLEKRFSEARLDDLDIVVLPGAGVPPTNSDLKNVLEWVEGGGVLLVVPLGTDEAARLALDPVCAPLGIRVAETPVQARSSIHKYGLNGPDWHSQTAALREVRVPAPSQDVAAHFRSAIPGLLDGMKFLTACGFELQPGKGWTPVLEYDGRPVIAWAPLGKGRIVVSGIDLFSNRFLSHPQFPERGTKNLLLVRRLLSTPEFGAASRLSIGFDNSDPAAIEVSVNGKGGNLRMPRLWDGGQVALDGAAIEPSPEFEFSLLPVPPGTHRIRIPQPTTKTAP